MEYISLLEYTEIVLAVLAGQEDEVTGASLRLIKHERGILT
jgi:hypothetical protein